MTVFPPKRRIPAASTMRISRRRRTAGADGCRCTCSPIRRLTATAKEENGGRFALLAAVAAAALALYPMALGLGLFDPYRLGYGSPWLLGGLFAVALAAWLGRVEVLAVCIALATLAWSVGWYDSTNLWDYLLDPLVSFYALGTLAIRGAKRVWHFCGAATGFMGSLPRPR